MTRQDGGTRIYLINVQLYFIYNGMYIQFRRGDPRDGVTPRMRGPEEGPLE